MPLTLKNFNKQGWTPGANTIAYYPLETDGKEGTGKVGLDITTTGITFNNGVAVLDGNQKATVSALAGYKTVALWFKKTDDMNGMPIARGDTSGYIQLRTNGFSADGSGAGADYTAGGSTPSNVWRCCVITQDKASNSGSSTGNIKFYLSDFGGVTGIRQYDTASQYLNRSITSIGWSGDDRPGARYQLIGNMSKLVVDADEWSLQDCEDFYDKTKGNYGL